MDYFEVTGGLIGVVISLLVIIFRRGLSHFRFISIPKGFGGKSFSEQFGEQKGVKAMGVFGLIMLTLSIFVLLAGLLGIELPRKMN